MSIVLIPAGVQGGRSQVRTFLIVIVSRLLGFGTQEKAVVVSDGVLLAQRYPVRRQTLAVLQARRGAT